MWILGVAVLAAPLLASCTTSPGFGPAKCDPNRMPTSLSAYEAAFRQGRNPPWTGGDGNEPTDLGGGRILWNFGDTYTGAVEDGYRVPSASGGYPMVSNSLILQHGSCFIPVLYPDANPYGTPKLSRLPVAGYRTQAFRSADPATFYWPVVGYRDGSVIRMSLLEKRRSDLSSVPVLTMATLDAATLRIRPIKRLGAARALGQPAPEGDIARCRTRADVSAADRGLIPESLAGSCVVTYMRPLRDGDHAYFYAATRPVAVGWAVPILHYAARNRADLTGVWEYWDGATWTPDPAAARPLTFTRDGEEDLFSAQPLQVTAYGGGYLAQAQRWNGISAEVTAWWGEAPTGPFRTVGPPGGGYGHIFDTRADLEPCPRTGEPSPYATYGAYLSDLPLVGWTLTYNVNPWGVDAGRKCGEDATDYGVRFRYPQNLPVENPYFPHRDEARGVATHPDGRGVVLTKTGSLRSTGEPGAEPLAVDLEAALELGLARDVAILPDGTGGYVLDGFGGIHPFAIGVNPAPPKPAGTPYWRGWDIARGLTVLPDGTGGYVLDGFGGVHPFAIGANPAPPKPAGTPYWRGWDIARGIAATGPGVVYVADGWGGIHRSAGAGALARGPYWAGRDIARGLERQDGGLLLLDGWGGRHTIAFAVEP